jgi:S-adenosylmethionine-diacylgycerolhomoserine-N-methlytransferase
MQFIQDLRVLSHLTLRRVQGDDHASRLNSFYAGQASDYDGFRKRLLTGREELVDSLEIPDGGTWIEMGGGTGAMVQRLADQVNPKLARIGRVEIVDLCESLLDVARQRIDSQRWQNVRAVLADATTYSPADLADVVVFSYSLTMIPDWFAAIENAVRILKPGGLLGVVDFYVARKYAGSGLSRHGLLTRIGWPTWFGFDNVFPSPDHLPMLMRSLDLVSLTESRAKVPFLPLVRVPVYRFVGRKSAKE